ncbi:alginate O-acetyltransferase [Rhodopseudomonas sp. HC1]|uniref:alginate O-acetyltransferase AlgX-related protein n=1 Tax=Rhodopseudomonas infernalis TaxID=2897386 RepID=UPI001EE97C66|nr:alginate O-acetyltransferase [Rhodopseudomonas infernalis]MCG6207516.1 alginate O-acetyltransferase [Rhodopseudomonas infernalis]
MSQMSLSARIYAGALVGVALLFLAAGLITTVVRQTAVSSGENRSFAQLPAWPRSLAEWEGFPQRFDDYFNDQFGLRTLLLRLNTNVGALMLGRLPSNRVILGQHDWLFYAADDSLDLYANKRPLSAAQLADAREAVVARISHARQLGAAYMLVIAPDKHSIYPEHMPRFLARRDRPSQLDQLLAVTKPAGLPVVDLRAALLRGKDEGLVYYKDDTHWTEWGAYLGYRTLMAAQPLPDVPLLQISARQYSVASDVKGDLAKTANLPWVERTVRADPAAMRCAATGTPLEPLSPNLLIARSQCASANYKVVYIGDSFIDSIMKYVSQSFGEVVYISRSGFTPWRDVQSVVDREAPDLIIEQLVERHVSSIADARARE